MRIRVVAENQSSCWFFGQWRAAGEQAEVYEVKYSSYLFFGNGMLEHESVTTSLVDRDIANNAREQWRALLPWRPAVAEIDCRNSRESQERGHCFKMVMAVNDIRRARD